MRLPLVRTSALASASISAIALLAHPLAGARAASCQGPVPSIASASVARVVPRGFLNDYQLTAKVVNSGTQAQPKDTLQFVDIYHDGQKLDARGIPPLAPGQAYIIPYTFARSNEAGDGTVALTFRLDMRQPMPTGGCGNGAYTVRF